MNSIDFYLRIIRKFVALAKISHRFISAQKLNISNNNGYQSNYCKNDV